MPNVTEMNRLRQQAADWLKRWKDKGRQTTTYVCPLCRAPVETPRPPRLAVHPDKGCWDGLKTCLHCGELSFVRVYPDGATEVVADL